MVKENARNHTKSIKHISNKQVSADPLIKVLPPSVLREHIVDMSLRESL
jgi:hypothetical protein